MLRHARIAALLPALAASPALAQDSPQRADDRPDGPHERTGDPHMPGGIATSAPGGSVIAEFESVQVNVRNGANIRDDAANEPSIVVDPRAPNRIVIGWRQFDNIASNFRQAGYAYSHDGGRTWTAPPPLDRGVFRSDPVLRADDLGRIYYYSLTANGNQYSCQLFRSDDAGLTWDGPRQAYGGDKQWFDIDRTGGVGHRNWYAAWDTASIYAPNLFTRSVDRGNTFLNPITIPNTPEWGTVAVAPNGNLYVCGRRAYSEFFVIRSTNAKNGGTPTWDLSRLVNLGGSLVYLRNNSPNPGGMLGQPWVRVNPTSGHVYLLCSVDPPGNDPMDVMFARSTDHGQNWSAPVKVNTERSGANTYQWFGTMSVAPNGRIDVVWLDGEGTGSVRRSALHYSASTDGGANWSPKVQVSEVFDSHLGWPNQNKLGDYIDMESDLVGANVAYAATFNGEQDVYFLRIGQRDCNGNGIGDDDEIASGGAKDCNKNGMIDSCEIAAGTAKDDNRNGIPDECETCYPDCDANGRLDIRDFFCFQAAFAAKNPYADCDGNSLWDIRDFFCFQAAYANGCQ